MERGPAEFNGAATEVEAAGFRHWGARRPRGARHAVGSCVLALFPRGQLLDQEPGGGLDGKPWAG